MSSEIKIRLFSDADLDEVLEVLRLSLGEPPGLTRTRQLFAWKHFDNPFGRSLLLIAEAERRIAGFRAFMRWDLIGPSGISLRCVRAVDTATHPDFQRRGVFRQLTLAGIDLAEDSDLDLIFNTPNAKSGAGYLTMGWREVGSVGVMVRPRLRLLRRESDLGSWPDSLPTPSPGSLEGAVTHLGRPPRGWRTPRTPGYLGWRYGSHPSARFLLGETADSVAIGRVHRRGGHRELVLSEVGGGGGAIDGLRRSSGADYLVAWFSPGAPERRWALRKGLLPVPGKRALTLMARPLRGLDLDLSSNSFDLSLGDLELL